MKPSLQTSTKIELKIWALMTRDIDRKEALEESLSALEKNSPNTKVNLHILRFIIQLGGHKNYFKFLCYCLQENKPLPWLSILELISQSTFRLSQSQWKKIFKLAIANNSIKQIINFENYVPDFYKNEKIFLKTLQEKTNKVDILKTELLDQLQFIRSQRMEKDEEKILNKLLVIFPKDKKIAVESKKFKEKWARNIISKNKKKKKDERSTSKILNFGKQEYLNFLFKQAIKKTNIDPKKAYDLAIFFYFLDDFAHAYKIMITKKTFMENESWFLLKLLYALDKNLEALGFIHKLEKKYFDSKYLILHLSYWKALNLKKLGETNQAISILEDINKLSPNFGSSKKLIRQWKNSV